MRTGSQRNLVPVLGLDANLPALCGLRPIAARARPPASRQTARGELSTVAHVSGRDERLAPSSRGADVARIRAGARRLSVEIDGDLGAQRRLQQSWVSRQRHGAGRALWTAPERRHAGLAGRACTARTSPTSFARTRSSTVRSSPACRRTCPISGRV